MEQAGVPVWAIVVIVVLVIICVLFTAYFVRHRRNKRKTDTKVSSIESLQTLVTHKKMDEKKVLNVAKPVHSNEAPPLEKNLNNNNIITDKPASVTSESQHDFQYTPPEPPQEIKISLPLPPPSTCFFSDKMELNNSETHDFYDMFVKKPSQDNSGGFISIDLDMPSFYANTAANIQQKVDTLRSTLRQSLKRQKSKNKAHAQNLFSQQQEERKNSGDIMVTQKKSSYEYQPPEFKEASNQNKAISESTNKTIIPSSPPEEEELIDYSKTAGTLGRRAMLNLQTTLPQIEEPDEDSPMTPNTQKQQEPVRAAKKVIRTASKKTKTRSTIVNEEGSATEQEPKHGPVRYASFRGIKNGGEHITLTTGSMRRMVRQSVVYDEALAIPPQMASMSGKSTSHRPSRNPNASVLEIAGWFDTPKEDETESIKSDTAPSQYRASLASSVLVLNGTLSKSAGNNLLNNTLSKSSTSLITGSLSKSNGSSLLSIGSDKENPGNNTFRRGTLGRNTLRSLRANATNGVNRSLKGLFDYSATSSSKVAPEDSQKMELSTDNAEQLELPSYINTDPYASTRKKSVRGSTVIPKERPAIPTHYLPTSESSTKYALSDDEEEGEGKKENNEIQPSSKQEINNNILDCETQKEQKNQQKIETSAEPSPPSGEVHHIRRMLQDTWINNMKESGSMFSISSDTESVLASPTTTESSPFLQAAVNNSNKINTPRQNQSLLTKSLLTQQVKRTSQVLNENGFIQGPEPSASFSSSTVRTVVPANELHTEPINIRQNAVTSPQYGSNKYQESSFDERKASPGGSRFSTSPGNNNSAESSRGHSRKSSGGNSTATALRISAGYAANAKTWNGRTQNKKRPSVTQFDMPPPQTTQDKRAFFSTMRKGQKNRASIPWLIEDEKTPAERERDRYLEGNS